jgi:predicted ArsR family transcriptional regulator
VTVDVQGPIGSEEEIRRLVSALGDPTRRRVFFTVREADGLVGKDEVAERVGINRRLAGFHLDKLVEQGFLRAEFHRRTGRSGPGAGRPAKLYALAEAEIAVQLHERHYDLLATLLLRAMTDRTGAPADEVLDRVGFEFGRELAEREGAAGAGLGNKTITEAVTQVIRLLSRYGFAPQADAESGSITARACPFEEMAQADPDRVCALDRSIWRGVLSVVAPRATLADPTARARGDATCGARVVEAPVDPVGAT